MHAGEAFSDIRDEKGPVRGFLHDGSKPGADCLILTHGAGVNCQSPLLLASAEAFCAAGLTCFAAIFRFVRRGRTGHRPAEARNGMDRAVVHGRLQRVKTEYSEDEPLLIRTSRPCFSNGSGVRRARSWYSPAR